MTSPGATTSKSGPDTAVTPGGREARRSAPHAIDPSAGGETNGLALSPRRRAAGAFSQHLGVDAVPRSLAAQHPDRLLGRAPLEVGPPLLRVPGGVGRHDHLLHPEQRAGRVERLLLEHVEPGARQEALLEGLDERGVSTMPPRAVLISTAVGRIHDRDSASKACRVSSVRGSGW